MKNRKYIENQKAFIKREWQLIFRNHFPITAFLLVLMAVFLLFPTAFFAPPNQWKDATITLESAQTVHTGKGGSRLDIYGTNGVCYTINRNESAIKPKLIRGQQYTFSYSDNLFYNIVEVIHIDGVAFLSYDDAVKNYWEGLTVCGVIWVILFAALIFLNFGIYKADSAKRITKIKKYKDRIHSRQ